MKESKIQEKTQKNAKKSENLQKNSKKIEKNIKILGFHDLELNTYIFDEVSNPKAVVIIIHGMQEHSLRYVNFAHFLNKNDYIVLANDLRGHGGTMKSKEEYGVGEKDIFQETLQDQLCVINYASEKYGLPIYVFGHSYGSMLTQYLVQLTPIIKKAVICGTTNGGCAQFKFGNCFISLLSPFKKRDKRGGIVENLCLKNFGKKHAKGNWLTRDEKVFEAYLSDEYCGGSFPFSFYRSLMKNMVKANKGIRKIQETKLFLIAGGADELSGGGKKVVDLCKIYQKNKVDAKVKIYAGAKHELINETNKDEVYNDILDFYNN